MDFPDGADHTCLYPLVDESSPVGGMAHIAHLRHDLRTFRSLTQHASLVNCVGEGFLAVDVFAQLHRGLGNHRVCVVGCSDDNSVNVLLLFEHLAEVGIALGLVVGLLQLDHLLVRLPIASLDS
jgi:hypothetical protein